MSAPADSAPRFSRRRSIVFSVLIVATFFGAVEGILRVVGVPRPVRAGLLLRLLDTDIDFPFLRADRETFWAPIPGFQGEFLGKSVSINQLGLRGAETTAAKARGRRRLVVFGDSITFGYGVADGETYAARLGDLGRDRGLEVLNAGVTGFTSHQALAHLRRVAPLVQADYVTICIGWNDMTRRPTTDRVYAAQLARAMAVEGLLDRTYIYRALKNLYARAAYRRMAAAPWTTARVPPDEYRENLVAAVRRSRELGIRPALVALPHRKRLGDPAPDPTYPNLVRSVARELDVPVLEVGELDYATAGTGNERLFIDSLHFSAEGNSRLAEILLPQLEALGWI